MTTAQVVKMSVTVNNNSPIQDYIYPDNQTQPTFEILFIILKVQDIHYLYSKSIPFTFFANFCAHMEYMF